jgi:mono/diheme cytochrome c family protein
MRKIAWLLVFAAIAAAAGLYITRPASLEDADIAGIEPDLARGELVFHAAGCASCHAADGSEGAAKLVLAGGHELKTPVGSFFAPNISQDVENGIGGWSRVEIVTAVMKGTSPSGRHYFPAFPYAAYGKAELSDIVSLAAYLETLPADPTPNRAHALSFPFSIRAGNGAWKLLNVSTDFAVEVPDDPIVARGQYLAEALAHCGECHTSRTLTQGLDAGRWLGGAPNPSGEGSIPSIEPSKLDWSESDIAYYLESGFRPDFDTAGGSMVEVVESLSALPKEDREAIAAYLKAIPPLN